MRTLPHLITERSKAPAPRSDASVRDSVRTLSEVVSQLCERIEILEARELLARAR